MPKPEISLAKQATRDAVIFYGSSNSASLEALDMLAADGLYLNAMRLRAFPFAQEVVDFIHQHDRIVVIDQNRDGQMRKLLIVECEIDPRKLLSYTHYDGMPMTALGAASHIAKLFGSSNVTPLRKKKAGEKA